MRYEKRDEALRRLAKTYKDRLTREELTDLLVVSWSCSREPIVRIAEVLLEVYGE